MDKPFPNTSKVRKSWGNEVPLHVTTAEVTYDFILVQGIDTLRQLSLSTDEIGTVVAMVRKWDTNFSLKPGEAR